MIGDMHCHTKLSDGSMSIDDLVFYAKRAGLSFLSITDHDTMDGVTRAVVLGKRYGVRVIPGVELSCRDQNGEEVHILCYLPEKPDRLLGIMGKTLECRTAAGKQMVEKVMRSYPVTEDHITRYISGSKAIYPAHILQALMDLGYTGQSHGKLYQHLFHPWEGICAVSMELPEIGTVLKEIHSAGGLAVLAHPAQGGAMNLLKELAEKQLIHGVEAFYPQATEEEQEELLRIARSYDLLVTGGSDFHGFLCENPQPIATCAVDEEKINAMFRLKRSLAEKLTV